MKLGVRRWEAFRDGRKGETCQGPTERWAGLGWSPRTAGPMAPAASVAARKLSWSGSVTEQ